MNRILVLLGMFVAALCVILWLLLLISTTSDTARLTGYYPLLLILNAGVALFLLGLVLWQLRALRVEYHARKFGARLKFRLMWMFGTVAVIPGLLVYGVSIQFVTRSIDSWFDVRVEEGLSSGIYLGHYVLEQKLARLEQLAKTTLQSAIPKAGHTSEMLLQKLPMIRKSSEADYAAVYDKHGRRLALESDGGVKSLTGLNAPTSALRLTALRQGLASTISGEALELQVLLSVGVQAGEKLLLLLGQRTSPEVTQHANRLQGGYQDYQELLLTRESLAQIYGLTLTLSMLLALFTAFALALEMARRLTTPLFFLEEGTKAVSQGDFSPRKALKTSDELGTITQSFVRMTEQLDETQRESTQHREDLEAARAYLESILANLSAGVLVFDQDMHLQVMNPGASNILDCPQDKLMQQPIDRWSECSGLEAKFGETILHQFLTKQSEWDEQLELNSTDGRELCLLLRGSYLPQAQGGYIVVFDDISSLLSAQRSAAWGEVARRLAHEIKNPLTPIQLSAERLRYKLVDQLNKEAASTLERCTQTIIKQVDAMKDMVNNFRDYARVPPAQLSAQDLNKLVLEVLTLYESSDIPVKTRLEPNLPLVLGDEFQLSQVIHNLVNNACDALHHTSQNPCVELSSRRIDGNRQGVHLLIEDNGPGFQGDTLRHAFEPYVTTKHRGTGLGLAIVKKIIEEHHGSIEISNRQDTRGARVSIFLVAAKEQGA